MTEDEINKNIALLSESLTQENAQSWQHITKLFELYASGNSQYKPLLDLVKALANSTQSKLFRAGASVTLLMISTKEKNGLEKGDPYIYIGLRDEDLADIGYYTATANESEEFKCKNDEILPVIQPFLDRLWNETRGKKTV
ncbi:MAG: hypothetical protein U0Z26_17310 [Anaerolineales bacterium]